MSDEHEDTAGQLLRLAGARAPMPDARLARVRAAVRPEWQAGVRRRAGRRRIMVLSVVAAAAALVLAVALTLRPRPPGAAPAEPVAVVERVLGLPRLAIEGSAPRVLSPGDRVPAGAWIETRDGERAALRLGGVSARLDVASRARASSFNALELTAGAVYVDSGDESGRFEVRTPAGIARDIGTQFEVRLLDDGLRVRVRSGMVELTHESGSVIGRGGTEVALSAAGTASRPFAAHGPDWEWAAALAPPARFEGATLAEYLRRLAREQGWTVRYADPGLEGRAAAIVLHGAVDGLPPRDAVAVAIDVSGLRHELDDGLLTVRRVNGER